MEKFVFDSLSRFKILTGITLISLTPDPVSLKSLSLSGSEPKRASALFFRIDFERLCVSPEPSVRDIKESKIKRKKNEKAKRK